MNNDPHEQHDLGDAELDEALLDQALRPEQAPEALEQKVLALTDPKLLSLLDEALAPEATTDALADRIIAATTANGTQAPAEARSGSQPAVIARIGFERWKYAAAAALVLAAGVGLWVSQQTGDPGQPVVKNNDTTSPDNNTDNSPEIDEDTVATLWPGSSESGSNAALFTDDASPFKVAYDDVSSDVDNADTFDSEAIWEEVEAYDEFFSTLESGEATPET